MKRILMMLGVVATSLLVFAADPKPEGGPYTETVDGIEWTFMVQGGTASVGTDSVGGGAVPKSTTGSITIPSMLGGNYVTNIRSYAFRGCTGLANVTIPNSVTSIGDFAFEGCSRLTSVTIPSSVWIIGSSAFDGCSGLMSVTIPEGVTCIANFAFRGCCGLTSVAIPSSVRSILGGAFNCCSGLTSFEVDKANQDYKSENGLLLTKDGTALVSGVNGDVTIPSSVTSIRWIAFYGCSGLTSVTIPSGVTSIENGAFNVCSGLTSFKVDKANPNYKSENGLLLAKDGTALVFGVNGDVTIPLGVTSIGDLAFDGCSGLTSVTIPDSVTSIGYYAFRGCSGLTSMEMPEGVTNIGEGVFFDCSGLTSVTIPSGVTSIGYYAFRGCSGLTSVAIPNSVTSIGSDAFYNCSGLTSVTIPSSVTNVGASAFSCCSGLTSVTIPSSVTSIGNSAFYGCSGLTSVVIPSSVTSIGDTAFCGCVGLTSVAIPSSVTSIGSRAFSYCRLTSVTIPSSVTSIGDAAFSDCNILDAVDFEGAPPGGLANASIKKDAAIRYNAAYAAEWLPVIADCGFTNATPYVPPKPDGGPYKETVGGVDWTFRVENGESAVCCSSSGFYAGDLSIPSVLGGRSVTRIGEGAFARCDGLTSIQIPSSVTSIEQEAFALCTGLTVLTIPESVTNIGDFAFARCTGLTAMTIPESVDCRSKVGVLAGCSGLTSVALPSSATPDFGWLVGCRSVASMTVPAGYPLANWFVLSALGAWSFECESFYWNELYYTSWLDSGSAPNGTVTNVTFLSGGKAMDSECNGCTSLQSVTVPASVRRIGSETFKDCSELKTVKFLGDAPDVEVGAFYGTPRTLQITVPDGSVGWSGGVSSEMPATWAERPLVTASGKTSGGSSGGSSFTGTIVVTNVVIHYVVNSVQPNLAIPLTTDTKFVNVMTEVKGGNVAIPDTWASSYPTFATKYGSDFTAALTKTTGKVDAAGNPMYVWQDYVAGTDPTKEDDVFTASITIVDGVPVVSYTPELTAEQKALRIYKTFGKKQLQDVDWTDLTGADGEAKKPYNFFKVTVEMK